jgi:hypothetical protein
MQISYLEAQVDCLMAHLEIHRGNPAEGRRLLDQARGRFDQLPLDISMYVSEYESDLAMELGEVAAGRRIRLELLKTMEERGDLLGAHQVRYELDHDPRDPEHVPA